MGAVKYLQPGVALTPPLAEAWLATGSPPPCPEPCHDLPGRGADACLCLISPPLPCLGTFQLFLTLGQNAACPSCDFSILPPRARARWENGEASWQRTGLWSHTPAHSPIGRGMLVSSVISLGLGPSYGGWGCKAHLFLTGPLGSGSLLCPARQSVSVCHVYTNHRAQILSTHSEPGLRASGSYTGALVQKHFWE